MRTGNDNRRTRRRALSTLLSAAAVSLCATALAAAPPARAANRFITVASTTSTQNSGLFGYMLPKFTAKTGIHVHIIAVGTGAALRIGRQGDADVVLVHARAAENKFVAEGWGVDRRDVMYNDFVIVGPKADPAGIKGMKDVARAMARIAAKKAPFASRADDSGTNKKEIILWKDAGVNPKPGSGKWYFETGSGMGATLNTAAARETYTLTDRATWLAFKNRGDLEIMVQGDKRLFNPYGVIMVNPKKYPSVKVRMAQAFMNWLTGKNGQAVIASYRLKGTQLFHPDAKM